MFSIVPFNQEKALVGAFSMIVHCTTSPITRLQHYLRHGHQHAADTFVETELGSRIWLVIAAVWWRAVHLHCIIVQLFVDLFSFCLSQNRSLELTIILLPHCLFMSFISSVLKILPFIARYKQSKFSKHPRWWETIWYWECAIVHSMLLDNDRASDQQTKIDRCLWLYSPGGGTHWHTGTHTDPRHCGEVLQLSTGLY